MNVKAKILFVDDHSETWAATVTFLEANGMQVFLAENGEHALSLVQSEIPELVLVTSQLTDMDGLEMSRRIKELPGMASIFLSIFLDGQNSSAPLPAGLEAGVDDYIVRPITDRVLLHRLQGMLKQRGAQQAVQRKEEQLRQSLDEMAVFNLIGQQNNLLLSLDEILPKVIDQVFTAFQPDRAFIFLLDEGRLRLRADRVRVGIEADQGSPSLCIGECLCGLAFQEGKSKFSRNINDDFRCTRFECQQIGMLSIAALPIREGQDVIGVLGLSSRDERDFEQKAILFEALAAQVSLGVQNARLYGSVQNELQEHERLDETLRAKNKFLEAMQETTLELVSERNLGTLLKNIVQRAGQLVGTDTGEIDLVDFLTNRLKPQVAVGEVSDDSWLESELGEGVVGRAWQSALPFVVDDYDEWDGRMQQFPKGRLGAVAAVPLIAAEKVIGVLMVSYPKALKSKFGGETVDMLVQFGRLATLAITNSRLFTVLQQELVEHSQSKQALQASETEFRSVVESSPLAMCFYLLENDGSLILKDLNSAAEHLLNASRSAMLGNRLEVGLPGITGTKYPELFRQVARGEIGPQVFEIEYKDEHFKGFIEVHVYQINTDRILTELIDITERKRAEVGLQESEFLMRESQRIGRIGSYSLDITTDSWVGTDALYEILGVDPGMEKTLAGWVNLVHPDERVLMQDYLTYQVIGEHLPFDKEYRIRCPLNGEERWVWGNGKLFFDAHAEPVRMIGTIQDITERKQTEEQILKLNLNLEQRVAERTAQLQAANNELESFSYSVSHDLRAPLRGIDGWSLALMEDYGPQLGEQGHNYLVRVRSETQRMGRLIDDLLQFSRIARGEIRSAPVDLSVLVKLIVERLRETREGRDVEFVIQPELAAQGDGHLLEIVLTNLINNACKFTSTRPQAKIEFGQTLQNGKLVYFVRDNGVGFDMIYAKNLFGAFQRMHNQSEFPGSGIGLATVQRIIHRHGGMIWADAQPDKGAVFYFTLEANAGT